MIIRFDVDAARAVAFLRKPKLVISNKNILEPCMVLAVDGSVTLEGEFRSQVGDSFIINNPSYEQITQQTKATGDIILNNCN